MQNDNPQINQDKKQKPARKVNFLPFLITNGAIAFLGIAFIFITHNSSCSGWGCLGQGLLIVFAIIALFVITYIIWLIYCIVLSIQKKRLNEKHWFIPLIAILSPIVVLFIIPTVIYLIIDYNEHIDFHNTANVTPEIIPAETVSSIPKLDGYKIIGKDISAEELFNNNESHINEKVLLKGFPEKNEVITYSETGDSKSLMGKERTTMIKDPDGNLYSISFIDTGSEFYDAEWKINVSNTYLGSYGYHNYFAYIYGRISSVITNHDKTAVQITPEKIYYTEDKDLSDYLNIKNEYSSCAKPNNKCSDEDIKKGQLVNVPVNNSENLDFYILKDDGENLTLMSKNALVSEQPLSRQDDLLEILKFKNQSELVLFPYSSLEKLYELTNNWENIPPITSYSDSTENSYLNITDGKVTISLNGDPEKIITNQARTRLLSIKNDLTTFDKDYKIFDTPCVLDSDLLRKYWGATSCILQTMDLSKNTLIEENFSNENLHVKALSSDKELNEWPNFNLSESTIKISERAKIVPVIEIPKTLINQVD